MRRMQGRATGRALAWAGALALAAAAPAHGQRATARPDTAAAASAAADTAAAAPQGSPVMLRGDTLLVVLAPLGPFTAADRAEAIEARLARLTAAGSSPEPVLVRDRDGATDLTSGDVVLLTLTDADAVAAGAERDVLAARYARALNRALRAESLQVNARTILLGLLYTALATAALVLVLRFFGRLFPRAYRLIGLWKTTRIPSVRIQRLELVSSTTIARGLVLLLRALRVGLTALLLYLYVPLVFSFFPWTRDLSSRLVDYVIEPIAVVVLAVLEYLPNLFFIAAIVVATYYLLTLIKLVFDGVKSGTISLPGFYDDWAEPTYKIVRFLVIAFAVIMVWPYLPRSDSEAFKGVAAFLGLLLTFGSASAVGNIVGGVVLIYMRPFQVGDRVRISDTEGDIVEKGLLATRIRTPKNVDITVPNAMVLGAHIVNFSSTAQSGGLILHTTVTIGYDVPWRIMHETLYAAAAATEGILTSPPPFVLQTSLDDFYVSYQVNAYTDRPNAMAAIYSALHQNIQDRCNEVGIEIMSPHYGALRDGSRTTIPEQYLSKDYAPPGWRVERVGSEDAP